MTHVAVIGAGASGMSAAYNLSKAGLDVSVVEARARVGGRVWSEVLENGEVAERGGEYFDSSMVEIIELSKELGLEITSQGFSPTVRPSTDPVGPSLDRLEESSHLVAENWRSLNIDFGMSIQDIIDGAGIEKELANMLSARMSCHRSVNVSQVSAYWTEGPDAAQVSPDHHMRIRGGNQQLMERMAKRLGDDNIRFRWPVGSIEQSNNGYTISSMTGQQIGADAIVLALPISVLKTLPIEGLDERTRDAIARVGFGDAAKLHLTLKERCTPGIRQDVKYPYSTWAPAAVDQSEAAYIVGFAATKATQANLDIANGPEKFIRNLKMDWPEATFSGGSLFTNWGADPWTRGAYSFRPVGWTSENEQALVAPNGRIFFAGEHTDDVHRSLICGAIRSGQRAARQILETV